MTIANFKRQKPILVNPTVTMEKSHGYLGVWLEILLLYIGLFGYILCNDTALDMGIALPVLALIPALTFALMILLSWYRRVLIGVVGGLAALSLAAFPITFKLYAGLGRALAVCYNYTIYQLGSQEGYSNYLNYMTMNLDGILENPVVLNRYFYTLIIMASLAASLVFALALFKRIPIIVAFLVPLVGLAPFFYFGIVPHYVAFSLFMSALVGCYGQSVVQWMTRRKNRQVKKGTNIQATKIKKRSRFKKRETHAERLAFATDNGSFGLIIAGLMLVISIGTAALIYSRPILEMDAVRAAIDNAATGTMNTLFRSSYEKNLQVAGYMEDGDTLSMMMPSWRGLTVCTVATTTDTPVYLRYRTMTDFSEEGWSTGNSEFMEDYEANVGYDFCEYTQYAKYVDFYNEVVKPSGEYSYEDKGYIEDSISVYPKYKVSDLLGLPSGAINQAPVSSYEDLEREGDTVLRHNDDPKDRSYMYQVYSPLLTSNKFLTNFEAVQNAYFANRQKSGDSNQNIYLETNYSRFVNRHYTNNPEELDQIVGKTARDLTAAYPTKLEKVQAIERYFRDNFKYNATRQRLVREDGTPCNAYDYIEYFLNQNENKDGYCTLFATSMVAMLRNLSIPARVVTGYYAKPYMVDSTNFATALSDRNFHAWVEVYFDGAGWLNFEPTPDFGVTRNYYLLDLVDQDKQADLKPEVVIVYIDDPNYVRYSNELPDPTEKQEEQTDTQKDAVNSMLQISSMSGLLKTILKVILVVLLLLSLLLGGEIWHRRTVQAVMTGPPTEGVKKAYGVILRLMQLQQFMFFEGELLEGFAQRADNLKLASIPLSPIVPILEKALYSELAISEEEREAVATYVRALDRAVFKRVNPFRAFWYKLTLHHKPRHKALIWYFS